MHSIRTFAAAAALALAAAPARAQAPPASAGPLLPARLDEARLAPPAAIATDRGAASPASARATLRPALPAAADGLSKPRLQYSAPLAAVLGLGGAALGYAAGLGPLGCEDESPRCAHGPDDAEYLLAYAGLVLGATAGAHVGGLRHDSRGSLPATLGAAAIGALPIVFAPKDDDQTAAGVASLVGGAAGAALLDYLVRRPRH